MRRRKICGYRKLGKKKNSEGNGRFGSDGCRNERLGYHLLCTVLGVVYFLGFLYGNEVEMIELEIENEEIRTR
jgi:hypothetical protein